MQEVAGGDQIELALEEQHLAVRADLLFASAAADVAERLGEIGDVVDQAEAMHHRIDDAGAPEIHRARRPRIRRGALVGGDDLLVRRHGHHRDAAPQLIEDGELAQTPGDELELFAVFARHRRLNRVLVEQEVLKPSVEQQRHRNGLIVVRKKQRQRGAEGPVALQQVDGDLTHPLDGVAERLEVASQISVHERPQLAQIRPDELLGENQNVVGEQPEKLQSALFFAIENR